MSVIADKKEKLARSLYDMHRQLSDEVISRTFDYLDSEEKFNWLTLADVALEEIQKIEQFQLDAIVEGYRSRGPFSVPKDWSYEDAMSDYFKHGWTQAFDSYYDVPDEASNGFS
jgi:hypothetical protein